MEPMAAPRTDTTQSYPGTLYPLDTIYPAFPVTRVLLCFTELSKQLGAGEDSHPGPPLHHGEIWG